MKLVLILSVLFSSLAFGEDYQCNGLTQNLVLRIVKDSLQFYELEGVRLPRGQVVLLKELGDPVTISRSSDGFRHTFKGAGFDFVMKETAGIITRSTLPGIETKNFFCGLYTPYRPIPPGNRGRPCRPRSCP